MTLELVESVAQQIAVLDIVEAVRQSEVEHLCKMVQKVAKSGGILFEIGSWKGYSAAFLGEVARQNGCHLYCVDHWHGSPGVLSQNTSNDCCLSIFRQNMASLGLNETVLPMAMSSATAGGIVADNIADFIFIDADHRYASIKADLDIWWRKLKVGGILCGHDCDFRYDETSQSNKDIIEKKLADDFTYDTLPYSCHPGVVKAVWERFGDDFTILGDTTIWMVEKRA